MKKLQSVIQMKIRTLQMFFNMLESAQTTCALKYDNRQVEDAHDKIVREISGDMMNCSLKALGQSPTMAFRTVFDMATLSRISRTTGISLEDINDWFVLMSRVIETYDNFRWSPRLNRRQDPYRKYVYIEVTSNIKEHMRLMRCTADAADMRIVFYGQGPSWTRNKLGGFVYGVKLSEAAIIAGQMVPKKRKNV